VLFCQYGYLFSYLNISSVQCSRGVSAAKHREEGIVQKSLPFYYAPSFIYLKPIATVKSR
jgi:hypothetical protein